jgi:hypothetical protein
MPSFTQPQSILELCEEQKPQLDPVSLRRIFLLLTRNHFASPEDNFGGVPTAFKKFKYSDDPKEKTVHVDLDYLYKENDTERRPAVFVGVGDFDFETVVLDHYADKSEDNATTEYVNMASTQIVLSHVALSPDEASMLGTISASFYLGIRPAIKNALGTSEFDVKKLTKAKPIKGPDAADTQFRSDLIISLRWDNTWETHTESHRVKKISFNIEPV